MQNKSAASDQRAFLIPLQLMGEERPLYCLLSQNQINEVLAPRTTYPAPLSPAYLQGCISFFGDLVPVIDLSALFGGTPQGKARQLVVIRTGEKDTWSEGHLKLALKCSAPVQTIKLTAAELQSGLKEEEFPAHLERAELIKSFYTMQGSGVFLVDFNRIVRGAV